MADPPPQIPQLDDYAEFINGLPGAFVNLLGLRFLTATGREVTAEMTVQDAHLQPYGILHGGVHCSVVESVASAGAALEAMPLGRWVVGVENRTRFIRPARPGAVLRAVGRPRIKPPALHDEEPTTGHVDDDPVWLVDITDDRGRLVASGQVRLRRLEPGTSLSGREVGIASVDAGSANE